MKKSIRTHGRTISYAVRKSARAKHVRISVNCDGIVLVTRPVDVSFARIEEIVLRRVSWIIGKIEFFKRFGVQSQSSNAGYVSASADVLALVQSRIEYYNASYGFTYNKIAIRNQRTRWGSCSKKGNLNFNYRMGRLAPELIDYIVVHELCHLAEMNHSKNYWKLVERAIPRYNALRKALKQNSL